MYFLKELNYREDKLNTVVEDNFMTLTKQSPFFGPDQLSKARAVSQFEILKVLVHPYMGKEWTQSEVGASLRREFECCWRKINFQTMNMTQFEILFGDLMKDEQLALPVAGKQWRLTYTDRLDKSRKRLWLKHKFKIERK